jgi:uncharacterized protein YecT (DUF1311 family)
MLAFIIGLMFVGTSYGNSGHAQSGADIARSDLVGADLVGANLVGASFDCGKAETKVEKLICSDPEIVAADATMAKLYDLAQMSAFGTGPSNQRAVQREWLAGRTACTKARSAPSSEGQVFGPHECLRRGYRERNRELAVAILLSHPDAALSALREESPQTAPLYEALQLYLTKPASAKWSDAAHRDTSKKISALLQPFYADLKNDANKGYGLNVLSDIAATPYDAMESDAKLASVIAIISVHVSNDEGAASFPFPCSAIVQRPAMIGAAGPYFGSTLDNFLPWPDCRQSLPAQPRFTALAKALNNYWKGDCGGGTIRFAYYRSHAQLQDAGRIGLPVELQQGSITRLGRKGLDPKLVDAALAELADQYARYNRVSKGEAGKRARYWVGRLIATAGACES